MTFDKKPLENFIGAGIVFPIELDKGKAVVKSGFELIRSSINLIIGWPYGSRFYLSEFGSRIEELLEEPNDEVLRMLINTFVIDSINQWEKRIFLTGADIVDVSPTKIKILLRYRIINSQTEDSFIYPFYRKINK